jgi:subtilisin-like proprotein convertase family protein
VLLTALAMLVASGVALAATTTFANSFPIQIPRSDSDGGGLADPYPSQMNVQGLSGNVTDVDLKLNGYSHNFPDDVGVLLVGPQGQKTLVMSDAGFDVDVSNVNLTFDDEAIGPLPDSSKITTGTYKPTRGTPDQGTNQVPASFPSPTPAGPYATNLSAFDGSNPNGTWNLYVLDDSAGDVGQLASGWSLDITTGSANPPPDPQPDTTAPRVTSTNPAAGATGVSPTANVGATFSEDMQASTINGTTFKLFKKGSTTNVVATVSYEGSTDTATLDPASSLQRGAVYKAVVTTVAKDLAGNSLYQNPTKVGNQQKAWRFKVAP